MVSNYPLILDVANMRKDADAVSGKFQELLKPFVNIIAVFAPYQITVRSTLISIKIFTLLVEISTKGTLIVQIYQ